MVYSANSSGTPAPTAPTAHAGRAAVTPRSRGGAPGVQVVPLRIGERVDPRPGGLQGQPGDLLVDGARDVVHAGGQALVVAGQPPQHERLASERDVHDLRRVPLG